MLRVAIVGCGKIADQHLDAIRRIPGTEVVGACDHELLMAEQLAERRRIPVRASALDQMLDEARPDVVHVTTPPQSHLDIASRCLARGCHVYVEKPFTVDASEAATLLDLAAARGLKLTVGHNLQFTWEMLEARALVQGGYLGGAPVHIESYFTYGLGDPSYARALLGDKDHWVRRLPGRLLHNIISHGISRIAEYLDGDRPLVRAFGATSPFLRSLGETDIVDELRVHVSDGANTTGYFVFTTQIAPPLNGARIYGPRNSVTVDNVRRTLIRHPSTSYKSFLNYFLSPLDAARESLRASRRNVGRFLRGDFHDDSGLKNLVDAFYRSVREEAPLPISHREILVTARIMDEVFGQLAQAGPGRPQ